jgi:Ca-activated chloride channel family protein
MCAMNKNLLSLCGILFFLSVFAQEANNTIHKANQYYRSGAYDLAILYYREALKENPQDALASYNLANSLYRHKKYAGSIEEFKRAANAEKPLQKAAAYYNEGVVHSNLKNPTSAIELYKKTLRIDPNDTQARENLQKALSELKKQQDQKNKQDKSKSQSKMSQKEVEQKLKLLQEKEKQLQQRLQKGGQGGGGSKDW